MAADDAVPPAPSRLPNRAVTGLARLAPWLVSGLLMAGYAAVLARHFAPAISTPDANGYWAQGSLLATTGRTWFVPQSDVQYVGMHWLVAPDGRYFSRYPPGLAVPIALVYRLFGPSATVLINPVMALAALLGMFLLTRRLVGPWWGALSIVLLVGSPDFVRHSLQNDSHMAVTALLIWGMWLLLRWHQDSRWTDMLLAGIVLGAIPTVRYPEALYALGVGAMLVVSLWRQPQRWPQAAIGLAGALVPVLPLMVRNHLAFGAFWRTAYSLTHEQTGFSREYFRAHAVDYLQALNADGVGLFFGLGLAGMALLWFRRDLRPWAAFLSFAVVPITLVYMAYYWVPGGFGHEPAAMRFVLPTFACYYLAGIWLLSSLCQSLARGAGIATAVLLGGCHLVWGALGSATELARQSYSRQALAVLTRELHERVPPGAVIVSSNPFLQHLDFVRLWKCADVSVGRRRPGGPGLRSPGESDAPMPMQPEKRRIEASKYAGQGLFGTERAMAYDLREWAAGAPVYFVGSIDEVQRLTPSYFGGRYMKEVTRVAMPEPPAELRGVAGPRGLRARRGDRPLAAGGPPGGAVGPGAGPRGVPGLPGGPGPERLFRLIVPAGPLGLSPELREVVVAEWIWEPAGPR